MVDQDKNISASTRGSEDARGDDESVCLTLSLSIGSQPLSKPQPMPEQPHSKPQPMPEQPHSKPQQMPEQPHNSPMALAPPPSHPAPHFLTFDAPASSWPLGTTLHQPMVFQVPLQLESEHNLQNQILPVLSHGGEQPSVADVQPPRKRGRVAGPSGALNRRGKAETIAPPYPWATDRRAVVHSYSYLLSNGLSKISGQVQCKRCERRFEMQYDLEPKFAELRQFIAENWDRMHNRAPDKWLNPVLPDCRHCEQTNCMRPLSTKKKAINWLFLLLGQLLGCCKLAELKYFCKHTSNHRTGAKDRVLYSAYMGLCKQLDPRWTFHM